MEPVSKLFTIDRYRLRVLRELADRGTVAATAAALHVTPSAVSQQLATLAREVGAPLLSRDGRGVRLTAQARILLDHASIVHAQLERARADLDAHTDGEVGEVVIGAFASAVTGVVVPALARLRRERPRLRVRVVEAEAPGCFSRLGVGELDVVITVDWRDAPHRADPRYARRDLLTDPMNVVLPADHPLAGRERLELADLADEPWVAGRSGPCLEVALAACAEAGFNPEIRHRTDDWTALGALVGVGAGVALAPSLALPAAPPGTVLRAAAPRPPARRIFLAVRAGAEDSPLLRPVIDALSARP
ncbi:LysR family transcriptional regulator [Actinoallomurus iriomotensis]|uniref:LysR family transcriptional regulator n=1 Tax=Actinoallomurus iriomotensis TaxID=478107 RepID=A0A9W6VM57_9ACTN|nr:LysR family transcriptional regulator [Actinoallomurus iriomotensis]GLY73370.1 LysR family transcriptional regulator [Actinoallomurus iriomotensis]